MRKFYGLALAAILCAVIAFAAVPGALPEERLIPKDEIVYVRVVGRDDTREGQLEKMKVREAALQYLPKGDETWNACLPLIRQAAEKIAPCRVELRLWQPPGEKEGAPTLYIEVGEAKGHNWWGVLNQDALLLAQEKEPSIRVEKFQSAPAFAEGEGEPVVFIWHFRDWLRSLLGL